ncbi:tetratricopeptide repeat protein [Cytophagaceae bacterium ABcell3]|nr:tetratricopeptide repeat protein [Cytophagaceae bacterium ABcell3]
MRRYLFKTLLTRNLLFCLFFFIIIFKGVAQPGDADLADAYFHDGEFEKAKDIYEKLARKKDNIPFIYSKYLQSLHQLGELSDAEKFLKKSVKAYPDNHIYRIDYYLVKVEQDGVDKSEKEWGRIVDDIKDDESAVKLVGDYLSRKDMLNQTVELYLASRKALSDHVGYAMELASVYDLQNKTSELVEELLSLVKYKPSAVNDVKNTFQNLLDEEEKMQVLETKLYEWVQKEAGEIAYNELLLWLHMQNKNFNKAFMQAKAIDKRQKGGGSKLIDVGKIAFENKDYKSAIKYFEYVTNEYKSGVQYSLARRYLLNAREELIKNSYPVDHDQIKILLTEYDALVEEMGKNLHTFDAIRRMALLYAFYMDRRDTAIVLLEDVIARGKNDRKFLAQAKMDLADIYLLDGEPWEASLMYSQVEKAQKDDQLGHLAKFKNAKLAYYKGEFELAQAHLDILKNATSREIANDAMELSILIQDNVALDTTDEAMREYAAVDLLLFQDKNDKAIDRLNQMLKDFPDHSLTDEIYMQKARIYKKTGQHEKAYEALEYIYTNHGFDILGDDALFMMAEMMEEKFSDKDKATELYQDLLIKYPGSIYTVEARKRIRKMRGDKI